MKLLSRTFFRCVGLLLLCVLVAQSQAFAAPKPLDPGTVRTRIAKRGVGNWVYIEENNGIALAGRIVSVDEDSFGLQLHNYPEVNSIYYSDVTCIRTGLSGKAAALVIAAPIAFGVVAAVVMHSEFEKNKPTLPTMPALP